MFIANPSYQVHETQPIANVLLYAVFYFTLGFGGSFPSFNSRRVNNSIMIYAIDLPKILKAFTELLKLCITSELNYKGFNSSFRDKINYFHFFIYTNMKEIFSSVVRKKIIVLINKLGHGIPE